MDRGATRCFICQLELHGDVAFVQHHLNQCLDSNATPSNLHAAAQIYDESRRPQASTSSSPSSSSDVIVNHCPSCQRSWAHLSIPLTEQSMSDHVMACSEASEEQFPEAEAQVEQQEGSEELRDEHVNEADTARRGFGRFKPPRILERSDATPRGTPNLLPILSTLLSRSHAEGRTKSAYLASNKIEFISGQVRDFGWGCGYRNAQMLYSTLRHLPEYASTLAGSIEIPSIADMQGIIEDAWKEGFDPEGASHFKHRLRGSKKWIGPTEIYVALTALGIRSRIIDFPKIKGQPGVHSALIRWITDYFSLPFSLPESPSATRKRPLVPPTSNDNAFSALMSSKCSSIHLTSKQPLFLQHQGHSRTVVGVEIGPKEEWLLIFDPGLHVPQPLKKAALSHSTQSPNKRQKSSSPPNVANSSSSSAFWNQSPSARLDNITLTDGGLQGLTSQAGKHLGFFRVSLKKLSRKDEYQVLYVEEGPHLTEFEKMERRKVTSTKIINSIQASDCITID